MIYIFQITRDRNGLQQSILKVPLWLKNNDKVNGHVDAVRENEYDNISQITTTNGSCSDMKTDIHIKHFDKNFNRSKSNLETISNSGTTICVDDRVNRPAANRLECYDRGIADGGSNQPDSDFDEFSSQEDDDDQTSAIRNKVTNSNTVMNGISKSMDCVDHYENISEIDHGQANQSSFNGCNGTLSPVVLSRCKALYSYTPKLYDELELTPGDIIEVHAKQEDGWWLGALHNSIGIFPATYVEEFV